MSLTIWYDVVTSGYKERLLQALFQELRRARMGENADRRLIETAVSSFVTMDKAMCNMEGLYESLFLKPFFEDTIAYYQTWGDAYMRSHSVAEYGRQASARIQLENEVMLAILPGLPREQLNTALNASLISRHVEHFTNEFTQMISQSPFQDAKIAYELLARVGQLERPKRAFEEFVLATGCQTLSPHQSSSHMTSPNATDGATAAESHTIVKQVSKIHQHFHAVCTTSFHGDGAFVAALDKSCRAFIQTVPKNAEVLARYCDSILRREAKEMSEAQLDMFLSEAVMIT